jgi:DNA polymerase
VFITNIVKHRPPENRDPDVQELDACRSWLERQVEIINPRVIVTLGRFSMGTFFPGSKISQVHGQLKEKDGRYFYFMYHPAAALHQQALRDTLIRDMRNLGALMNGRLKDVPRPEAPPEDSGPPPEQLSLF